MKKILKNNPEIVNLLCQRLNLMVLINFHQDIKMMKNVTCTPMDVLLK